MRVFENTAGEEPPVIFEVPFGEESVCSKIPLVKNPLLYSKNPVVKNPLCSKNLWWRTQFPFWHRPFCDKDWFFWERTVWGWWSKYSMSTRRKCLVAERRIILVKPNSLSIENGDDDPATWPTTLHVLSKNAENHNGLVLTLLLFVTNCIDTLGNV